MQTQTEFYDVIREWEEHCMRPEVVLSSIGGKVCDCDAYKKIVEMGKADLPMIRQLYDEKTIDFASQMIKSHGLVKAVQEIVRDEFQIPTEIQGKLREMEQYTARWLNYYLIR